MLLLAVLPKMTERLMKPFLRPTLVASQLRVRRDLIQMTVVVYQHNVCRAKDQAVVISRVTPVFMGASASLVARISPSMLPRPVSHGPPVSQATSSWRMGPQSAGMQSSATPSLMNGVQITAISTARLWDALRVQRFHLVSSRFSQLQMQKSTLSVHDPKLVLEAIHHTVVLRQRFYEVSDSVHAASALALFDQLSAFDPQHWLLIGPTVTETVEQLRSLQR